MTQHLPATLRLAVAAALMSATAAGTAQAHVTISPTAAAPQSVVAAKLVVGHGCAGLATTAVKVDIPAAIAMVHPMETPGWTLKVETAGRRTTSVSWSVNDGKGSPDAKPAFEMHVQLPATLGPVAFATLQTCGTTTVSWTETAIPNQPKPAHPAPVIDVGGAPSTAAAEDHSAHQH